MRLALLDHGQKMISLKQVDFDSAMPMTMSESRQLWDQLMHKDLDTLMVWRTAFNAEIEGRPAHHRRPNKMNCNEAWLSNKVSEQIRRLTSSESRPCAVNRIGEVKVYKNGMLPVTTKWETRKASAKEKSDRRNQIQCRGKKMNRVEDAKFERSLRRDGLV